MTKQKKGLGDLLGDPDWIAQRRRLVATAQAVPSAPASRIGLLEEAGVDQEKLRKEIASGRSELAKLARHLIGPAPNKRGRGRPVDEDAANLRAEVSKLVGMGVPIAQACRQIVEKTGGENELASRAESLARDFRRDRQRRVKLLISAVAGLYL